MNIRERRLVRLVAFRANNGHTATLYHFYLESDANHVAHDRQAFDAILHGFTLLP
jgi:hypothetical protein